MTVDPGNYCELFLPKPLEKIREIRKISKTIPVEVDVCMDPQTFKLAKDSGANVFATGSYILKSEDIDKAVKELQDAAA